MRSPSLILVLKPKLAKGCVVFSLSFVKLNRGLVKLPFGKGSSINLIGWYV